MGIHKHKKKQAVQGRRFLISITVPGSAGPIRFVVNENELVAYVIRTALKSYAREGRLPVLGSDLNSFMLYSPITGCEALSPWDTIGSSGGRNFMLCKKPESINNNEKAAPVISRKGGGRLKAWFQKSLSLEVSSH